MASFEYRGKALKLIQYSHDCCFFEAFLVFFALMDYCSWASETTLDSTGQNDSTISENVTS